MVERVPRIRPRTEFLVGLAIVLVGAVALAGGLVAGVGWIQRTGIVVLLLGLLALVGMALPRRDDGTRIWQTDQGKAV
jgi:hypothetical protein